MGFGFETTAEQTLAGIDLSGKTAVVTGATSGIGLETARALASAGARVVITARDKAKADEALVKLRAEVPKGQFESAAMELGSLKSVRAAAKEILSRHPRIDILINNAGVMATPFGRTEDGFETQFGVDHLGHFVFTNMLAPALIAAAPSRVVCLSSAAHLNSDVLWDDVNFEHTPYDKFKAYGQAKTANMLFALGLDKRLAARGVRANGVHPGVISTNLGRYMTKEDIAAMMKRSSSRSADTKEAKPEADKPRPSGLAYKSIPQGAASSVWAATSPELAKMGGAYIEDCHIAQPHERGMMGVKAYALDPASAERLWAISEKMVGQSFAL
jgi:NAD(P)-dependent dehydrogenase (short-subunit alcohol dehydrogenase family)